MEPRFPRETNVVPKYCYKFFLVFNLYKAKFVTLPFVTAKILVWNHIWNHIFVYR